MTTATESTSPGWMIWAGRVLTALPVLALLFSAVLKLRHSAEVVGMFTGKFGYPEGALPVLGAVELICVALYLFPRTAVLGVILITGYLGGATATHARVGDPFLIPIVLGMMAWGGLYFRDARVRALIPLRS